MEKARAVPHIDNVTLGKSFAPLGPSSPCVCVMADFICQYKEIDT